MPTLSSKPRRHARRDSDVTLLSLADQVRAARIQSRLSQQELALASGVGRATVIDLENGREGVSLGNAQRILSSLRLRLVATAR